MIKFFSILLLGLIGIALFFPGDSEARSCNVRQVYHQNRIELEVIPIAVFQYVPVALPPYQAFQQNLPYGNNNLPPSILDEGPPVVKDNQDTLHKELHQVSQILRIACYSCHNSIKSNGDIYLFDSQNNLAPNIELENIWFAIKRDKMPKGGPPLSTSDKEVIRRWILQ